VPVAEQAETRTARRKKPDSLRHRITLRAMVFPENGSYVAECIDLNLLVKRATPEEAAKSLEQAIIGYIETVLQDSSAMEALNATGNVAGLLPRKSALTRRIRYHCYCLVAAVIGNRRDFQLKDYTSFQAFEDGAVLPPGPRASFVAAAKAIIDRHAKTDFSDSATEAMIRRAYKPDAV